jgi:hypothetical protein
MIQTKNRSTGNHRPVLRHSTLKVLSVLFLIWCMLPIGLNAANGTDSLGLRIDVLPNGTINKSEPYSQNRRLWLVTSEAKPTTRTIRITSSVGNSQLLTLQVASAKRVGNSTELDMNRSSEIAPWTKFSRKSFVLPAFGQEDIQVTVDPPKDLKDYSQDAFLIVKAGATSGPKVDKTRTTAVLSSQFQYATPIFYGVGKIENLMSIQIKDIDTYLDENGKYGEVEILNNGVGPVEISGDIQFTNLDFQTGNIGPLQFSMDPLQPGKSGFGTIRLPEQMVAGKWKVFIQAYVGSYGEAVVITKNLSFDYKRTSQVPRFLFFFACLLVMIFLLKLQRRLKLKIQDPHLRIEQLVTKPSGLQILKSLPMIKRTIKPEPVIENPEFTKWLDSLIANNPKPKRAAVIVAKKAIKPAARKPVKKSVPKSPAMKKSTSKKVAAKKKSNKKVAVLGK